MIPEVLFDDILHIIKQQRPSASVIWKGESTLHRLIGKVMFFNSAYMTSYTTTIGGEMAFPRKDFATDNLQHSEEVLAHEGVHAIDDAKHPVLFKLGYLFPQILAVLAALSVVGIWWRPALWALLALLFAAPLPAPFRVWAEMRGYQMTMAMWVWRYSDGAPVSAKNHTYDLLVDHVVKQFTSGSYYWMLPFESIVRDMVEERLREVLEGKVLKDPYFRAVHDAVRRAQT